MMTDIKSYLDFVFSMFFAFGVAFEVPVAVIILSWVGVVNPETLAEKRPYIIVGAFVVAAVLTPPDVLSQFLLAIPMLILFEVGLFIARRLRRTAEQGPSDVEMEAEFDKHEQALATTNTPSKRARKRRGE
jgi:sec-independent protein translocase protein TatC